jgi:hypothetical protein
MLHIYSWNIITIIIIYVTDRTKVKGCHSLKTILSSDNLSCLILNLFPKLFIVYLMYTSIYIYFCCYFTLKLCQNHDKSLRFSYSSRIVTPKWKIRGCLLKGFGTNAPYTFLLQYVDNLKNKCALQKKKK